jgi:hypothetical protein
MAIKRATGLSNSKYSCICKEVGELLGGFIWKYHEATEEDDIDEGVDTAEEDNDDEVTEEEQPPNLPIIHSKINLSALGIF